MVTVTDEERRARLARRHLAHYFERVARPRRTELDERVRAFALAVAQTRFPTRIRPGDDVRT